MIPHRMLKNEISSFGLRERVSACRKRLRGNRGAGRPHAINEVCELFAEAEPETVVAEHDEFNSSEVLSFAERQEVGIT